jgi:hypothetical protein
VKNDEDTKCLPTPVAKTSLVDARRSSKGIAWWDGNIASSEPPPRLRRWLTYTPTIQSRNPIYIKLIRLLVVCFFFSGTSRFRNQKVTIGAHHTYSTARLRCLFPKVFLRWSIGSLAAPVSKSPPSPWGAGSRTEDTLKMVLPGTQSEILSLLTSCRKHLRLYEGCL